MPIYLTCEADLDFPGPSVEQVVAQVRVLYRHRHPVTVQAVAKALGADRPVVEDVLRRATGCRLIRRVLGQGWVPLIT